MVIIIINTYVHGLFQLYHGITAATLFKSERTFIFQLSQG